MMETHHAERLKAEARRRTGLDDFGPDPFEESVERLVRAFNEESRLRPDGLAALEERLLDSMEQRLKIQDAINRHPEILDVPIADPVIITGLNRTGTTKLHRLMSTHQAFRTLPLWEALNAVPLDGEARGDASKRIAAAEQMVAGIIANFPATHAGHPIFAEVAEEETYSSQMQLQWTSWFGYADVPGYMRWVNRASMRDGYRWWRKVLQYLVWQNGGEGRRWLLKAPFHLGFLDDLFEVFPDLSVIQCHRLPLADPVASLTKLVTGGRPVFSASWDIAELGQEILSYYATWIERTGPQRERHVGQIFDVAYRDTFERGEELLGAIHGWLGLPYGPDEAARVKAWEDANPQHAHGRFSYTVEECGLDPVQVNKAFGAYADWAERFMDRPGMCSRPALGEPTW
jgi:hypothetical protein